MLPTKLRGHVKVDNLQTIVAGLVAKRRAMLGAVHRTNGSGLANPMPARSAPHAPSMPTGLLALRSDGATRNDSVIAAYDVVAVAAPPTGTEEAADDEEDFVSDHPAQTAHEPASPPSVVRQLEGSELGSELGRATPGAIGRRS